ncbi:MAG: cobalamin-binding protein [Dehalococcoidia bacterium]|nr:cobalamin-binding protein [Dehalococcoidia bacterium]
MGPKRIVCLTAETTEIAFAVGAGDRVVGVSGYAVRPPEARTKPKVAAFQTAHVERILAVEPDLVLGFSDLQADIARELIRAGVAVLITNQRTLRETAEAIALVGAACGQPEAGREHADRFEAELAAIAGRPGRPAHRPRVYFEEWDNPLISGIAWVSELIELCGGEDIFPELRGCRSARDRVVEPEEVVRRDPEVIVASWCGKKARLERIAARPGWEGVSAVQAGRLYEIKSPDILAPGPSLLHGARQLAAILDSVTGAA